MPLVPKWGADNWQAYRTAYPELYYPFAGTGAVEWGDASLNPGLVPQVLVAATAAVKRPVILFVNQTINRAASY